MMLKSGIRKISAVLSCAALLCVGPLWSATRAVAVTSTAAPTTASASNVPSAPSSSSSTDATQHPIPVFAYFYQWFNPSSWNRAKIDLPLAGKYSSDDAHVLRDQVQQARAAGIDGFLTSWKSTEALNRRLDLLIRVAQSEHLDLGVVYEALDFGRKPLPIATVKKDMVYLVTAKGASLKSSYYGRPVIIWTGTDQYSVSDVQSVRSAVGDRAYLLAASKTVAGYQRVADIVDGEAYYWSSADPTAAATSAKLLAMSQAVHAHRGLWIAPAATGYDGRTLGGTRVIDRRAGQTLVRSLTNAFATSPDGVGVISWNEWSENTYMEPGQKYGEQELTVLRDYLAQQAHGVPVAESPFDSSEGDTGSSWTGARAFAALGLITSGSSVALVLLRRSKSKRNRPRHHHPRIL
jgi:hypothetical protein